MTATSAHLSVISYDNAAGSPVDVSTFINSFSGLDLLRDMLDSTNFGSVSKTSTPGLRGGGDISISGDWGTTLHTQLIAIDALTTNASQTLRYSPAGTGSGAPFLSVETLLSSYTINSAVADKVTFSATLQMTGNVTTGNN